MPKLSARKNMSEEELKASNQEYSKKYYQKHKGTSKYAGTKKTTIENAIGRLMRSDDYIVKMLETVGVSKIRLLLDGLY
jgi:hypothetical protein